MPNSVHQLLRILVVEDDEDDFIIIEDLIKRLKTWKTSTKWVFRYNEAVEELCNNDYTICFSDYRLGAMNGIHLLKDIQQRNCQTPVILLTGKGNYEIDTEATKAGAFDYLIKSDLDVDKLERTIRYALERFSNLQKIRESERKYRTIFEKSKDIFFIADIELNIRNINYAVTDILELSVEETIGKKVTDFFKEIELVEKFEYQLTKDGELESFEVELLGLNQTIKNCLISVSIETDSEQGSYIHGVIHDITSRKKAEMMSLQAEKLAATGRFIRTLGHEVRNPLNNINLAIENIQQIAANHEELICLEIIERNARRINDLITELLQSSRPMDMDLQFVSMINIMQDVILAVNDRAILRHINISYQDGGGEYLVNADKKKLEMALLNILINAIEAVEDGKGIIQIILKQLENQISLVISDNGCGMNRETKARLFEPYFTSKRNGLGLGLATTLSILNAHNATVEVYSQINIGTSFEMKFN